MQDDEAPRTTIQELQQLLNDNPVVVVDVRGQESYLQGHIPGAISIPPDSVASRAEELEKADKPIVTYCS
jgi:rhodanese-related sulfurtransferase